MPTETFKKGIQFIPLIISLAITFAIGLVASLFTRPEIAGWYAFLQKPAFNPPAWLFAPVWSTLYVLIAIAAYLVWQQRNSTSTYKTAVKIYFMQLMLNFFWSIIFFGMHQVFGALIIITLLWISIILNIAWFKKFNKIAAWLLLPYLLWVSFAWILNLNIYLLNR